MVALAKSPPPRLLAPARRFLRPAASVATPRPRPWWMVAFAHLKKDPVTGHLLKNAAGHLVDVCDTGPAPCTDCDPTGAGVVPNDAIVSGVTGTTSCTDINTSTPFNSFLDTTDICLWSFSNGSVGSNFEVYYAKNAVVADFGPCSVSLAAGEWAVRLIDSGLGTWLEKTAGFSCDSSTGKISGTHTFTTAQCQTGGGCGGTPTITIDP